MKDFDELEEKTLFEIIANEGGLTHFVVGSGLLMLALLWTPTLLYYKLKSLCVKVFRSNQ